MIRKIVASLMWDTADRINWLGDRFAPAKVTPTNDVPPDDQFPVGTVYYTRAGQGWRVQANGQWVRIGSSADYAERASRWNEFNDVTYYASNDGEDDCCEKRGCWHCGDDDGGER